MTEGRLPVVVACRCPGTPHPDGDIIWIKERVDLTTGLAIEAVIDQHKTPEGVDGSALIAAWYPVVVRYGAVGWSRVDEAGEPVPFDVEEILADYEVARVVADAAGDIYIPPVVGPLVERLLATSRRGQTAGSTSRPRSQTRSRSGSSSRKRSAASKP